jgi:hypothetical protein
MLISTALLLESNIRNSVCTPAKLPCRRVEVGYEKKIIFYSKMSLLTLLSLSNTEQSTKTQYFRHLYQYYQVQEG